MTDNLRKHKDILEHIVCHCLEVASDILRFGDDYKCFERDDAYQRSSGMAILQIGELATRLSKDFRATYTAVPWENIVGMRHLCAHGYWRMSRRIIWNTMKKDIPALEAYCNEILAAWREDSEKEEPLENTSG